MNKKLEDYMNKQYRIEINPIPDEEGGGFAATLPQFGHSGIVGDGDTIDEAISSLIEAKRLRFENYLEEGLSIPEPEEELHFSGKFLTRVPKFLHKELVFQAKRNGVSLNQLVTSLLASSLQQVDISVSVQALEKEIGQLKECICNLDYKIDTRMQLQLSGFRGHEASDLYEYKDAA